MEGFNKARVMEVSDKIQALLNELAKEEGIQMSMAGGKFTADSFTLKISGKLLEADGSRFISKSTNIDADWAARRDDISYSTPHFIGSVWRFRTSGLVCVEEYSKKNRKYPYICSVYGEGRRIKAAPGSFKTGEEVKMPTAENFYVWFVTDVESDAITQIAEETCDNVNDYISCRYESATNLEKLYDLCGKYYDRYLEGVKKVPREAQDLSNSLYESLIKNNDVEASINIIRKHL